MLKSIHSVRFVWARFFLSRVLVDGRRLCLKIGNNEVCHLTMLGIHCM